MLSQGELSPVDVRNPGARSPFLLVSDHAGRAVPRRLADIGLPAAELERHIAWDLGIAGMGARLADALGACLIAQRYSRLVIDCNRDPSRADAIPEESDRTPIPGNLGLSPGDRAARVSEVFRPYHDRIAQELDARAAAGQATTVIALHSFTPAMQGVARPWAFGVLHMGKSAFSDRLLALLRAEPDLDRVGDNEPYAMDGTDYTIPHHAIGRGLEYAEIETRQDLLGSEEGQGRVAERLARLLPAALG